MERGDFSIASLDKLIEIQSILDNLESILNKSKKELTLLESSITRIKVISDYEAELDDVKIQVSLWKYEEFIRKDGDDETHNGVPKT